MIENKINELAKKIEIESKKLDKKIRDIEKIKSSITKDLKKNVRELKTNQLKKLQEEKKNITDKVKEMKSNLSNAKKESTEKKENTSKKVNKKIDDKNKIIEKNKKPIDKTAKKIMNMMALYNKNANKKLIEILLTVKEKKIENEDILNCLNEDFTFNINIDEDLNSLIDIRKKLDDVIIAIVNSIEDFNISGKVIIPNAVIKKPRYHLIMHALNHSTHHRGEISVMLDQMEYKNDYSNLMTII